MGSTEIISYIQQNLQLGYDLKSIRNSLISSGYTAPQVDAAIDYMNAQGKYQGTQKSNFRNKSSHDSHHIPTLPLFLVGGLIIVAFIIGAFAFIGTDDAPTYQPPTQDPSQNLNPGQQTPTQNTNTQNPTSQQPTTQNPSQNLQQPQTVTQSDISSLTRLEIDEEVEKIAATQPQAALDLCAQIITRAGTFTCITKVAFKSEEFNHCENIVDLAARDTCYMQFPINELGDNRVCQKVANEYKSNSCFELYEVLDQINGISAPELTPAQIESQALAAQSAQPTLEERQAAATGDAFSSPSEEEVIA